MSSVTYHSPWINDEGWMCFANRPTLAGLAEVIDKLSWLAKATAPTHSGGNREEIEL
jgi:hypothetical protein